MANLMPCKVCESQNIHSLADWLITAQGPGSGFDPGTTFWVCQPCLAGLMLAWVQEQQGEPTFVDPDATPEGDGEPVEPEQAGAPGALEQVEHDEGKVSPAPNGSGRKSESSPADAGEMVEGTGQAATADVNS